MAKQSTAKQSTADYYRTHPDARKRRLKQQSAYQKTAKGKAIKKNANRLNRALGTYGNHDDQDASHYKGSTKKGRLMPASKNRAEPHLKNKNKLKIKKK